VVALQGLPSWIGKGSDASMLTRLKSWIQGSRRKSGERWEADRGHLSEQERHHVDAHEPAGTLDVEADPQALGSFDEHRRGRPGN
jgi:hypothetical protein